MNALHVQTQIAWDVLQLIIALHVKLDIMPLQEIACNAFLTVLNVQVDQLVQDARKIISWLPTILNVKQYNKDHQELFKQMMVLLSVWEDAHSVQILLLAMFVPKEGMFQQIRSVKSVVRIVSNVVMLIHVHLVQQVSFSKMDNAIHVLIQIVWCVILLPIVLNA